MTIEQEQHLHHIKESFTELVDGKYRGGQAKHGGDLFDLTPTQLIEEAINEAIDQVVYLITCRDNLKALKEHYEKIPGSFPEAEDQQRKD